MMFTSLVLMMSFVTLTFSPVAIGETTDSQPQRHVAARSYTMQTGIYTIRTQFEDVRTGDRRRQRVLVRLTNRGGKIRITAISNETDRIFANPIVGILKGNEFSGHLDDYGGHLTVEATLIRDNEMDGIFYDKSDRFKAPFELRRK